MLVYQLGALVLLLSAGITAIRPVKLGGLRRFRHPPFLSYALSYLFRYNFHCVIDGRLYRSGYLPPLVLKKTLQRYGIKSVVNLTLGGDAGSTERQSARSAARAAGADYFEVRLNSGRLPSQVRLDELLRIIDSAPMPSLIHCRSGTHRSGVATAIWLLEREKVAFTTAASQLTAQYGYFRWERRLKSKWTGRKTLDELLWGYQQQGLTKKSSFREWSKSVLLPYDTSDVVYTNSASCPDNE